jgi:uncharacterized membrane protein YjfL (UPF0719 family)
VVVLKEAVIEGYDWYALSRSLWCRTFGAMELRPLYLLAFAVGTTLGMLILLQAAERLTSPHTIASDLKADNAARRLVRVGQVIGVFLVAASAVKNSAEGVSVGRDVMWVAAFGSVSVLLLAVTGRLGIRLLLQGRLSSEIDRGNSAAGLAAGANYVSAGIITSRAIGGTDLRSLGVSLVFFVIAQLTLHVFVSLFRALTTYDDAEQIHGENFAAALSYSGALIAFSIIIARALDGDFVSWSESLRGYGAVLLLGLMLYPVRQIFVQVLMLHARFTLRGGRLDSGIAVERNEGMGAIEAAAYLATALSIARLV